MELERRRTETLETIGRRQLSVKGFRKVLLIDHLRQHAMGTIDRLGQQRTAKSKLDPEFWCSIECATRVFEGRVTEKGKSAMRKRLPGVVRDLLEEDILIVVDHAGYSKGHHGEAVALKIYSARDVSEEQATDEMLDRFRRRHVLAAGKADKADRIRQAVKIAREAS